jgi:hypothetical protein
MLVESIAQFFKDFKEPRYRDRRGWDASGLLADSRDMYWKAIGEPETNPVDIEGRMRMMIGKAVERELTEQVIANLHWFGLHTYGNGQIQIGGSKPIVNGLLDGLIVSRSVTGALSKPVVLEVKVKTGFGADLFLKDYNPGDEYLAQMGYYLKDLTEKGKAESGLFLFICVSDSNMGVMVEVECTYDAATQEVRATSAKRLGEIEKRAVDYRLSLGPVLERLTVLEQAVKLRELPPQHYVYKYPITGQLLADASDYTIRDCISGKKVIGDWQIKYSRFKDKHLALQKSSLGYSHEELQLFVQEYKRRHPKSKVAA